MKEETIVKPEVKEKSPSAICSSYDDECVDVQDPFYCWIECGRCGIADGLCPLIHTEN